MIEILSSSCSKNKEISCISTCNCYFDFCFYLAENSLNLLKKNLVIVIIFTIVVI